VSAEQGLSMPAVRIPMVPALCAELRRAEEGVRTGSAA
jgi:hypothetical protein